MINNKPPSIKEIKEAIESVDDELYEDTLEPINFQECVDRYITSSKWNRKAKDREFFPSEITGCLRQAVRHRLGLVTFDIEANRNMAVGTMFHKFLQTQVALGYIDRPIQFEKQISYKYKDITFNGHVDAFDGENIYDFKTSKNIEWSLKYNMQTSYRYQTSVYLHALEELGAKRAYIIYIDKRTFEIKPKEVDIIDMENIYDFCNSVLTYCNEYNDNTNDETYKILPPRCWCFGCKMESGD